jgi:dihydroorotase-like cyclic amidohydrolase
MSQLIKLVNLAKKYPDFRYIACHLTSGAGINIISNAQKLGLKIMIELTPHHLYFSSDDVDVNKGLFMCFPPIRDYLNQTYLLKFLQDNASNPLVCISSDSAPHLRKDKIKNNPNRGLATLQHIIPVILTLNSVLSLSNLEIENIISNNIASFLNLPIQTKTSIWRYNYHKDKKTYNKGKVPNPFAGFPMSYELIKEL